MKYNKAQGIVLKKTNYKETDQIVTIWSYEFGKMRVLARGLRLPKSKLAGSLQDLSLVNFEVTGRWPTIISAGTVRNFKGIRSNLAKMAPAFYVTELMLKTTADEHPNTPALECFLDFLNVLDHEDNLEIIDVALHSFVLKLLDHLGFGTEYAQNSFQISPELFETLKSLRQADLKDIRGVTIAPNLAYKLKQTINQLLEFVLERELKSKAFLTQVI
ncbi:MAG: DNA repair protein RecO [Candidatus Doudnabacteria bacterium]|nr:DNA repair protein RecO [Candidatus Doudnabacteria bacterium]